MASKEFDDFTMKSNQNMRESDGNNFDPEWLKGTSAEKDFSHPAYKTLSAINGKINKMSMKDLIKSLSDLNMDTGGAKEVLIKRLKFHHRKTTLTNANIPLNPAARKMCDFDFIAVIDFEATCVERNDFDFPHEIIEFPVVIVNMKTLQIHDTFDSFCRPLINPVLTKYCTDLTGITQENVDGALEFPDVLINVEKFLESHQLGTNYKFAVATDGPWDMQKFLNLQCSHCNIPYPFWAKRWIDIRKMFSNWYGVRRCGILKMLNYFSLDFEGQQHCGLDDAKNIARILIKLAEDGCKISLNDSIERPLMNPERRSDSFIASKNNTDT